MILENIRNAFRSIASAKLRSVLTMLGIIIGVFAVLTMIAIGDGVKKEVTRQITSLGTNVLTVYPGQLQSSTTAKNGKKQSGGINFAAGAGTSSLTEKDVTTAEKTANVDKVAPIVLISSNVVHKDITTSSAYVISTSDNYASIRDLKFDAGSFFTTSTKNADTNVAVIGATTKDNLFGSENAIGQTILVRNKPFRIVGVVTQQDTGLNFGPSFDDAVYLPFANAASLTGSTQIFRILVSVNNANNIDSVKSSLEGTIRENHGGQTDFSVLTQKDLVGFSSSILNILASFVIAIASISLLVGGIGIMNIMLVSVSERTREIGIRKAIGATRSNILWQFLIESIVISLLGGGIGLALSYATTFPVKKFAKVTPIFSVTALLVAAGMALGVGVVFGVVPAIKAARKRPIQALKTI